MPLDRTVYFVLYLYIEHTRCVDYEYALDTLHAPMPDYGTHLNTSLTRHKRPTMAT